MRINDNVKILLCLIFIISSCLNFFETVESAEFIFIPSIGIKERYSDNIFLDHTNEVDDFITSIDPEIKLTYNASLLNLSLDYRLSLDFYHKNTDEDELRQEARLDSKLSLYKEIIFIRMIDVFKRIPIDERRQVALDSFLTNTEDANYFYVNPFLEYPFGSTLKTRIGYIYENIWLEDKDEDEGNKNNHTAKLDIIKEINPKITSAISYYFLVSEREIEIEEDYNRHEALFKISYQLSHSFDLYGEFGRTWINFIDSGEKSSNNGLIQANYSITEPLSFGAGYSSSISGGLGFSETFSKQLTGFSETIEKFATTDVFKRKEVNGIIRYKKGFIVDLKVFKYDDTYVLEDEDGKLREDRLIGLRLNSNIPVTSRIKGSINGWYQDFKFLPDDENGERYSIGMALSYELKITTATIGYTYNIRNSDIDENDYINNIAWLQAKFTF